MHAWNAWWGLHRPLLLDDNREDASWVPKREKMAVHKEGLPRLALQTRVLLGSLMGTASLAKPVVRKLVSVS